MRTIPGDVGDFAHFHVAAAAMIHGTDIYAATAGRYLYPPLLAFVLQPLALFPKNVAASLWVLVNAGLITTSILAFALDLSKRWQLPNTSLAMLKIAAIAILLNLDKVRALFRSGQTDGLMLGAFVAAFLLLDRKPLWAGFAVGASANIKYVSLIFVPYFVLTRRYRAAFAAAGSFVLFLYLPALLIGLHRDVEYIQVAFGGIANMFGLSARAPGADVYGVTWNRSVSITSTVFRYTRAHQLSDAFALTLVFILFAIIVTALVTICRRRGLALQRATKETSAALTLEWMALVVLALIFSPQTTLRHMVLITLVYAIAVAIGLALHERKSQIMLLVALMLLVGALAFPPSGLSSEELMAQWRGAGVPSWCTLVSLFILIRDGCDAARGLKESEISIASSGRES